MKILAISGGHKNGTNDQMAKEALMGAQETGAQVEFVHFLDLNLKPCNGCLSCVNGKNGIMAGGSGKCVTKDDFLWLENKIYEADGAIFVMPVFEKGLPGFFRSFQDRFAGPSHDMGMLTVANSIRERKGLTSGGPDQRAFKRRFATYIGIGGADWTTRMATEFNQFGVGPMFQVVDNLVFGWAKSMALDDERVARVREAGRSLAKAAMDPESYKYLGDPGVCPNCHSRMMYLNDGATGAECSVCGIVGRLVIEGGKIRFEFPPEQLEHAHNLLPGKLKHADDIGTAEAGFIASKQTEEFKRRAEVYKAFIQSSKPEMPAGSQ